MCSKEGENMKKRTHKQIKVSKAIYGKHVEKYRAANYPEHRDERMTAYAAALTQAIVEAGESLPKKETVILDKEKKQELCISYDAEHNFVGIKSYTIGPINNRFIIGSIALTKKELLAALRVMETVE